MGPRYLPTLEGRASCERQRRDCAERHEQAKELKLCRLHRCYQPFRVFSGCTLVLLAVLVLPRNTKTDQTLGRSVALLAQLHPKCPFQVESRRVRAYELGAPGTEVLAAGGTICSPKYTGQYACLPISTIQRSAKGSGSTPRSLIVFA